MATSANPAPGGAQVIALPLMQSRVDPTERWGSGGSSRWGDLRAPALAGVIDRGKRGDVADYADLCEFALETDGELLHLYETRLTRVLQADWVVAPPESSWDPALAELAAELVNDLLPRIEDMHASLKDLLHAIAIGFSANEMLLARDNLRRLNYVSRLQFVHPHRFRYDEERAIRLYDHGRKVTPVSLYGMQLDPTKWIVHTHRSVATYAGAGGAMMGCLWPWMFGRWVEKFRIGHQEKYGSPLVYAKVNPNTPNSVRTQIMEDLQNLASEHVGVFEGHELNLLEAALTSDDGYKSYLASRNATYAKVWLGVADMAEGGVNGSQAAVSTRTGAAADPRMVADGVALASTLRRSLFKALCFWNLHKFPAGTQIGDIPLPEMRFKTADDEVVRDRGDKVAEIAAEMDAPDPKAPAPSAGQQAPQQTSSQRRSTPRTSTRSRSPFATTLRKG